MNETHFCVILISKNIMHPFARQHLEKLVVKGRPGQDDPWSPLESEFRGHHQDKDATW